MIYFFLCLNKNKKDPQESCKLAKTDYKKL